MTTTVGNFEDSWLTYIGWKDAFIFVLSNEFNSIATIFLNKFWILELVPNKIPATCSVLCGFYLFVTKK